MAETKDKLVTVEILDYIYDKLSRKIEDSLTGVSPSTLTITSFSSNPSSVEMGSTVNSVTLTWKLSKPASSITLDGNVISDTDTSGTISYNGLNLKSTKTWTLKATDEKGTSDTETTSITFLNRVYYGAASSFSTSLDSVLSSSAVKEFTANAKSGEYIWYALPSRMGACSFSVGGFDGGFSLIETINVTNRSGYSEPYYIYRSDNANLGSTNVSVKKKEV